LSRFRWLLPLWFINETVPESMVDFAVFYIASIVIGIIVIIITVSNFIESTISVDVLYLGVIIGLALIYVPNIRITKYYKG